MSDAPNPRTDARIEAMAQCLGLKPYHTQYDQLADALAAADTAVAPLLERVTAALRELIAEVDALEAHDDA